jgi:hypothetical protein
VEDISSVVRLDDLTVSINGSHLDPFAFPSAIYLPKAKWSNYTHTLLAIGSVCLSTDGSEYCANTKLVSLKPC